MCYSRPAVYAYVPNFVSIGLFCSPVAAKNHNFCRFSPVFWTSAFSGVANWQQSKIVELGCTTTNLSVFNGVKIVSVLQRLHGEIGRTNSDVQKRDEETDRQTDKNLKLLAAPSAGEVRARDMPLRSVYIPHFQGRNQNKIRMIYPDLCTAVCYVTVITHPTKKLHKKLGWFRPNFWGSGRSKA